MDDNELISIIIPVYNIEKYIHRCIQSIINQTYRNIEIIIVDDGSTDNSGTVCDELAKADNRIFVYHKQNGGAADARNYGLEKATGSYIGFVDGDDFIHPQMYELLLQTAIQYNADLTACKNVRENEQKFMASRFDEDTIESKVKIIDPFEAVIRPHELDICPWNKLYKTSLFEEIKYPAGKMCEDEFVFHHIIFAAQKIRLLDIPLYYYENREGSVMYGINEKRIEDGNEALLDRVSFVAENKWTDILPYAIMNYCDFCIYHYRNLKKNSDEYTKIMERLHDRVRSILNSYKGCSIHIRYRLFAISPTMYGIYSYIRDIKNAILKHGVSNEQK